MQLGRSSRFVLEMGSGLYTSRVHRLSTAPTFFEKCAKMTKHPSRIPIGVTGKRRESILARIVRIRTGADDRVCAVRFGGAPNQASNPRHTRKAKIDPFTLSRYVSESYKLRHRQAVRKWQLGKPSCSRSFALSLRDRCTEFSNHPSMCFRIASSFTTG